MTKKDIEEQALEYLRESFSIYTKGKPLSRMLVEFAKKIANQKVDEIADNAKTKDVKHDYTGVRAGGYYVVKEVDRDAIRKFKIR